MIAVDLTCILTYIILFTAGNSFRNKLGVYWQSEGCPVSWQCDSHRDWRSCSSVCSPGRYPVSEHRISLVSA